MSHILHSISHILYLIYRITYIVSHIPYPISHIPYGIYNIWYLISSDIDECLADTSNCNPSGIALCHNEPGGYTCSCPGGWILLMDGFTCLGNTHKIYITHRGNARLHITGMKWYYWLCFWFQISMSACRVRTLKSVIRLMDFVWIRLVHTHASVSQGITYLQMTGRPAYVCTSTLI